MRIPVHVMVGVVLMTMALTIATTLLFMAVPMLMLGIVLIDSVVVGATTLLCRLVAREN